MMEGLGFRPYEAYKDSHASWLGEVPADWEVGPGRICIYENKDKNTGMKESTVLSLSYGRVIVKDEDKMTGLVPESYETYQIVQPGDIIIRGTDLQNDVTSLRTGLAKDHGIITSAYINLRPKPNAYAEFLHYLLHSYDVKKVFYGLGSGLRQNLSYVDFKYLTIPLPSLNEQRAIVAFLDEKCAEIEEAVKIKEDQIALLRERRQIIIQDAVTRGLNPAAPMKDSGTDWIGQIPAHWDVKPLRRISKIHSGNGFPIELQGDERGTIPFMKVSDFSATSRDIDTANNMVSEKTIKQKGWNKVPAGALVTAKIGEALRKNHRNIIQTEAIIDNNCIAFEATGVNPIFFYWLHKIIDFEWFVNPGAVPSISVSKYKSEKAALPPLAEQRQIVEHIVRQSTKIDDAISIKNAQIAALKEYKTSLINAAVTGKIKVI